MPTAQVETQLYQDFSAFALLMTCMIFVQLSEEILIVGQGK